MHARRVDGTARLQCDVCGAEATLRAGDFESMNGFIQAHKACAEPWGEQDSVRWSGLPGGRP